MGDAKSREPVSVLVRLSEDFGRSIISRDGSSKA
jgi:hypothetical protein